MPSDNQSGPRTAPNASPFSAVEPPSGSARARRVVVHLDYGTHIESLSHEDQLFLLAALQHYARTPYGATRARCLAMLRRLSGRNESEGNSGS